MMYDVRVTDMTPQGVATWTFTGDTPRVWIEPDEDSYAKPGWVDAEFVVTRMNRDSGQVEAEAVGAGYTLHEAEGADEHEAITALFDTWPDV